MRRFLRFLMLVLMATWGVQGYAEYLLIKPNSVGGGKSTWTSGDITMSISEGYELNRHGLKYRSDRKGNWDVGSYDLGPTAGTLKIPVGSDLTFSCSGGYIDYILFSFNNGGGADDHSEHWNSQTSGSYHPHEQDAGHLTNKAWWEAGGSGVQSVTFNDNRTSAGSSLADKAKDKYFTQGLLWIYVFYHKKSNITQSPKFEGTGRVFCIKDTTVKLSRTTTDPGINNWNGAGNMFYTIDGSTPTTASSVYGNGVVLSCTREIKVLSQANLKVKAIGGDANDDDFEDCPQYYYPVSDVVTLDRVTKLCKVTFNGAGLATFAHDNNMTLPAGYQAAAYTIKSWRNGNKTPSVLAPITPYYDGNTNGRKVVKANTAVIVFGTAGKSIWLTNPLNDDPSNDGGTQTVSGNILQGNFSYGAATATNNSKLDFYYLMQEYQGSSKYGFYWGAADGRPASLGAHKAYFTVDNTARKSGSGAKGFVFEMPDDETTGIAGVFVNGQSDDRSLDADAPMYNAAGQRVGAGYKGLVIQNGRKFIKR